MKDFLVIRALSWNQPYASLMLHGKIETRRYYTNVRGKVLICACKKAYSQSTVFNISGPTQMLRITKTLGSHYDVPNGYAIGIGDLIACRKMQPQDEDKCFVSYHPDLYCWILENVKPIEPFRWHGKQGWSIVEENLSKELIKKYCL